MAITVTYYCIVICGSRSQLLPFQYLALLLLSSYDCGSVGHFLANSDDDTQMHP